ncbi:DNA cytosine methyltransferase [Treponema sp. OMZ 789]|uniref:DNA cytosine methyltransferase n=1 Tax=Treponema sp. OMZ 789 TaxID=2563670 RepID=UPI0020A4952F|nr:DNA cytosine methyltransferase [Treponema sp. OMZ 789]UTC67858.1 DNA cytosine methyltransferase [Treponema sp. OMZ 789]UTC70581.1 DNA cytosine methyltransferase [Treponema sp. OMZ 790]UTC73296.1 DNA cytosine methyltransferase [Treponema sp. OMZ 791]
MKKKDYSLENILENENQIDNSFYASPEIRKKRLAMTEDKIKFFPSVWHENKSGNISILDYSCALRTGASYNYLLVNGVRRFTPRELLRLQGFPDTYKIVVSTQEIRRQTGNSVAVPMIRMAAKKIDLILRGEENGATSETSRFQKTDNKRIISA